MKSKRNVLLLSAGRRVELLEAFRRELAARGMASLVLAGDLRPSMSAACQSADKALELPRVTEPGYEDHLLEVCVRHGVGLVVPTIDTELLGLSQVRCRFADEGVQLVVSDADLVRRCRDKRETALLFQSLGIDVPKILHRDELSFPCFAKPYDGSRSIGAAKLTSTEELTDSMKNDQKLMFMEYMDHSYEEYTVDAYFDRTGEMRCLVPRHRLEVRDGEISKGVTRRNHVYTYLRERLSHVPGGRGCLTVQIFAKPCGTRYAALEINPRFGGGYPLSYSAGANYPGWLIDEYLLDRPVSFFEGWEADLMMLRYDAKVLVHDAV